MRAKSVRLLLTQALRSPPDARWRPQKRLRASTEDTKIQVEMTPIHMNRLPTWFFLRRSGAAQINEVSLQGRFE
jgi:hypothetical protein